MHALRYLLVFVALLIFATPALATIGRPGAESMEGKLDLIREETDAAIGGLLDDQQYERYLETFRSESND